MIPFLKLLSNQKSVIFLNARRFIIERLFVLIIRKEGVRIKVRQVMVLAQFHPKITILAHFEKGGIDIA